MGLFKKKPPAEAIDLKCPADGCEFVAEDKYTLDKHLNWKHPELLKK